MFIWLAFFSSSKMKNFSQKRNQKFVLSCSISLLHQRRGSGSSHRRRELARVLGDGQSSFRHGGACGRGDVDTRAALVGASQREGRDDGGEADEARRDGVDGRGLGVGGVVPGGAGDVLLGLCGRLKRRSFFFDVGFLFSVEVSEKRSKEKKVLSFLARILTQHKTLSYLDGEDVGLARRVLVGVAEALLREGGLRENERREEKRREEVRE